MNEEQEKELLNILTNLPSESSWLDYKLFPYDNDHKAEFIKDVCSFWIVLIAMEKINL